MLSFLNKYAGNVFTSQNGEELLLLEICKRLDLKNGIAVEAGGSDGLFCSNTALLIKEHGWSGLFVEGRYDLYLKCKENWKDNPRVRSQCCFVDEKNINAFVDDSCDLLSLDTDGADYRIFAGLKAKPKVVIMEIDSSIPPNDPSFNSDGAAGYWRGVELGLEKGYCLLVHCGNLIFIDDQYNDLFPEIHSYHPLKDYEYYFNEAWLKEGVG